MEQARFFPAGLLTRIIAAGVDLLLGVCAMLIALMLWSQRGLRQIREAVVDNRGIVPEDVVQATLVALLVGAAFPFLFALQLRRDGTTPGKALMSLTVRQVATGAIPGYAQALGREALRFLCIAPLILIGELHLLVALVFAGVLVDMSRNRLSRTWYDRVTGTIVVMPALEAREPDSQ